MSGGRLARAAAILVCALLLSGCAGTIVAGLSLSQISTIASVISVAITGKDVGDHALSLLTGKDCNLAEGLLRSERDVCERRGSAAAAADFKGIFAAFGGADADPLSRYARARQEELATDQILESRRAAGLTVLTSYEIPDGVPSQGSPNRIVRVRGTIAYAMAPVARPTRPHPAPRRDTPVPRPKPKSDLVADADLRIQR